MEPGLDNSVQNKTAEEENGLHVELTGSPATQNVEEVLKEEEVDDVPAIPDLSGFLEIVQGVSCPECDFTAPDKDALKAHVQVKHPTERFPCSLCSFFATRKSTLKTHYASIHQ